MICIICGQDVAPDRLVQINGVAVDVDHFAEGLRRLTFTPTQFEILLAPTMDPMVAYKLGKTHVATIVAARRKAKKK